MLKSKRKQDAKGVHWAPYTIQKCCIVWQVYLKRQSTAYKSQNKKTPLNYLYLLASFSFSELSLAVLGG